MPRLVVVETLKIDREPGLDGTVEQVWLGEPELDRLHGRAELRTEAQSLAQAKEVVGGIRRADETAGDGRNAAVQLDGVLAALFHLERDVHGIGLGIALDVGGFFGLERLEVPS